MSQRDNIHVPRELQLAILKHLDMESRIKIGIRPGQLNIPIEFITLLEKLPRPRYTNYESNPPDNPWNTAEQAVLKLGGDKYEFYWVKCREHSHVPEGLSKWGQDLKCYHDSFKPIYEVSTQYVRGWLSNRK